MEGIRKERSKDARMRSSLGGKEYEHTDVFDKSETFAEVMADDKKKELFLRFLHAQPEIHETVRGIAKKYREKEPFTDDQLDFLGAQLRMFTERMMFANEAKRLLNPKEIEYIASAHSMLSAIMMLHGSAAQLLQDRIATFAMEHPDQLYEIIKQKREIDEKKDTIRYKALDNKTREIMDRYHILADELAPIQNITDKNERTERFHELVRSKMGRFDRAIGFLRGAYSAGTSARTLEHLDHLQKDELFREIEDHQYAIAEILANLSRDDNAFMAGLPHARTKKTRTAAGESMYENHEKKEQERWKKILTVFARDLGEATKEEWQWVKGMAVGIAGHTTETAHRHERGKEKSKKEKRETVKEEHVDDEDRYRMNPKELLKKYSEMVEYDEFDEVEIFLKKHLRGRGSKAVRQKVMTALENRDRDTARKLLEEHLEEEEPEYTD